MIELNLLKLIKDDSVSAVNRDGLTPLFVLAEKIANGKVELSLNEIEKKILSIDIDNLSIEELGRFLSFIYYTNLIVDKILNHFLSMVKHFTSPNGDKLLKVGLLLRFISERSTGKISTGDLLEMESLRQTHPWIWIDCVSNINWNLATDEISIILSREDTLKNLLLRIPSYLKRLGKETLVQALKKWYPNIKQKKDRNILEKWARNFEINIGLSLSAENLLENIPYYQKPVVEIQ